MIADVREDPATRISPALLDHAFAFSPAGTLTLPQLLDSGARLRGLGVFPQFHFDLDARNDGNFDVVFRAHELDGFGDSKLEAFFLFFQGLPFQEVDPQFYNLHRDAINFNSMYRWDAQKRRIFAQFSGPFGHSASYRWDLTTDLRNENWAIRNGFTGPAPVLASFNMRHEMAAFDLASYAETASPGPPAPNSRIATSAASCPGPDPEQHPALSLRRRCSPRATSSSSRRKFRAPFGACPSAASP